MDAPPKTYLEFDPLVVRGEHTADGLCGADRHSRLLHHHLRGIRHLRDLPCAQLAVLDVGGLPCSDTGSLQRNSNMGRLISGDGSKSNTSSARMFLVAVRRVPFRN